MTYATTTRPLVDEPYLHGRGPAECSSCTVLSVVPEFIYDVNSYYRELGVDPRATRGQLREAYTAADGQSSPRLTYVFRQLLQPEVRAEYDRMPLGSKYLDRYVLDEIHQRMVLKARARQAAMRAAGQVVPNEESLLRDLWAQIGLDVEFEDPPGQGLDPARIIRNASQRPAIFPYAYYLWRTRIRGTHDLERLAQWQELLVSALSREGVVTKFAVGLHGGMAHPWVPAVVGYRVVVFLHRDEQPTVALAQRAAARVRHDQAAQPTSRRKILP